jgi:GT2 family glycosyltransferase
MPADLTVVIPTYDRLGSLLNTLTVLFRSTDFDGAWDAIVVDDGSCDGTGVTVSTMAEREQLPLRVIGQANKGAAAARNTGAMNSTSDVLLFIDDDMIVEPGFLAGHYRAVRENPDALVTGRVECPEEIRGTPYGRWRYSLQQRWNGSRRDQAASSTSVTAQSLSLRRSLFLELGGFDERFMGASCEDWDLAYRACIRGARVIYDPRIVAIHMDHVDDIEGFCRRHEGYALGLVQAARLHGSTTPYQSVIDRARPVRWSEDSPSLVLKKVTKSLLSTPLGAHLLSASIGLGEWLWPRTRFLTRAYELSVAVSLQRGVRAALSQGNAPAAPRPP